jgi:hypothetical protein
MVLTPEQITLLIAAYGAVLGTVATGISVVLALKELRKEKRSVRVTCSMALVPPPAGDVWEFVSVKAVNTGHRPVQITSAGLFMNDGNLFFQVRSNMGVLPLPKKLEDGDSVQIFFDYSEVEKAAKQHKTVFTRALVCDAEGKEYSTKMPRLLKDRKLAK